MDLLLNVDWRGMFVPQQSILEMVIRGTIMYLGMFALLRIFRRQAGSISIADLLLIVIIADAAQNGMAGESKSVTEALVLIGVIIFWDYLIDWLGFSSKVMARVLEPQAVELVRNGRMNRKNMNSELISEDELMSRLREQGVEDIKDVKLSCLEANGEFSVIKLSGDDDQKKKSRKGGIK